MKISIIINTFNRPDFLRKSLISLSNQSIKFDELIISDDGSSEDLISVIKEFINSFDCPIYFINQADIGFRLARCRNNAVRIASGDFLIFLDQDLIYTKFFIETMISNIKKGYFLVAWPIRSSQEQALALTEDDVKTFNFSDIITPKQIKRVKKQFHRDRLNRFYNYLHLKKYGTKFRGGVAGIFKTDYNQINGYDEKYIGWGNEDDDFGRRLYYSGIKGFNPFYNEYPIHLWHPENHNSGFRINATYHKEKALKLSKMFYKCEFGLNKTLGDDKYEIITIKK